MEAKNVDIENVTISDILNTADEQIWVCGANWQLQPSEENIQSYSSAPDSSGAARVSGVEIVRSEAIVLDLVTIESLKSEEGGVVGIDISGDANDRTDHDDDTVRSGMHLCAQFCHNHQTHFTVMPFQLFSREFHSRMWSCKISQGPAESCL